MITKKSVLVLGAGASYPFQFPLGKDLLDEIEQSCDQAAAGNSSSTSQNGRDILSWLQPTQTVDRYSIDSQGGALIDVTPTDFGALARAIRRSRPVSIDSFLHSRNDPRFTAIASLIIADVLLRCEAKLDPDHPCRDPIEGEIEDDWLVPLLDKMTAQTTFDKFLDNNLKIITFNYDRSLEYLLIVRLAERYGVEYTEAAVCIANMGIHHVYGSLGAFDLRAMERLRIEDKRGQLESWMGTHRIRQASAQHLRLMHDVRNQEEQYKEIRAATSSAEHIMFLGFGFDPLNLSALGVHGTLPSRPHTHLASKGLPVRLRSSFEALMTRHGKVLDRKPEIIDGYSTQALNESSFLA